MSYSYIDRKDYTEKEFGALANLIEMGCDPRLAMIACKWQSKETERLKQFLYLDDTERCYWMFAFNDFDRKRFCDWEIPNTWSYRTIMEVIKAYDAGFNISVYAGKQSAQWLRNNRLGKGFGERQLEALGLDYLELMDYVNPDMWTYQTQYIKALLPTGYISKLHSIENPLEQSIILKMINANVPDIVGIVHSKWFDTLTVAVLKGYVVTKDVSVKSVIDFFC